MSKPGINETDLSDLENREPLDHQIRRLEIEIEIAKEKCALRVLEEQARQRKLKEMGHNNPYLDSVDFPAFTAHDFSG